MNREDIRRNRDLDAAEVTVECRVQIAIPRISDLLMSSDDDPCVYKYMGVRLVDEFPMVYRTLMRDWAEDTCKLNSIKFDIGTDTLCPVLYNTGDENYDRRSISSEFAKFTADDIRGYDDEYQYKYNDARLKWIPTKLLVADSEGLIHFKCHGMRRGWFVEDILDMTLTPCGITARNDKNNLSFEDSLRYVTSGTKMFYKHIDDRDIDLGEGMLMSEQIREFHERFSRYAKSYLKDVISHLMDVEDEYASKVIQDVLNGNKTMLAQKYMDDIFPAWDRTLSLSDYPDVEDAIRSLLHDYDPYNGRDIFRNNIL